MRFVIDVDDENGKKILDRLIKLGKVTIDNSDQTASRRKLLDRRAHELPMQDKAFQKTRAVNIMRNYVGSARELCMMTERAFADLKNCGDITMKYVRDQVLSPLGLRFGMTSENLEDYIYNHFA
jgi:hypothetical protein